MAQLCIQTRQPLGKCSQSLSVNNVGIKRKAVTTLLTKLRKTKNLNTEESNFVPKVPSKTKCKFTITSEENAGISQYWCYLSVIAVTILY